MSTTDIDAFRVSNSALVRKVQTRLEPELPDQADRPIGNEGAKGFGNARLVCRNNPRVDATGDRRA